MTGFAATKKFQAACLRDFSRACFQLRGVSCSSGSWLVIRGSRSRTSLRYAWGSTPCSRQFWISV
jgi:hypothetical protein